MTDAACELRSSLYYSETYLRAAALLDPEGVLRVFRHGQAVVPMIVKRLPPARGPGTDAVSPYDFCGPLLNGESPAAVWNALHAWASERDMVAAFFRFHPFHESAERWRGLDGLEIVRSARNVVIELDEPDAMMRAFKPTVLRDLKVARRAGVTCELRPADRDGLGVFVPLYGQTMDRHGADDFYRFPRAFFDALVDAKDAAVTLGVAKKGADVLACALILLDHDETAYYYLACSSDAGRKVCAMNALVCDAARRLRAMGFKRFHLGGGAPGLLAFKQRFGRGHVPYYVGRAVFDAPRYARLTRGLSTDYFPAYRAPAKVSHG